VQHSEQNRCIPAVQLTQLRKLCNKYFQDTGVVKSSQLCSTTMEVPGSNCELQWKLQQMPGIRPVTMPNPAEVTETCMWLLCEGDVGCTRCCAMSAALVPRSCNQGCGRCAHQLSERANASSPCLNINHKPLETNKKCSGGGV
jgi:hypothetical protein